MPSVEPQMTLAYYRRLFPWKSLYHWLNHQIPPTRLWTHREFAFTLQGDAYLRWNSFKDADDLKREVCRLNPSRFEVGAIYSGRPRDKKTIRPNLFVPNLRELVFDIDMDEYNEVRTCCSGKQVCKRCWGFIASAVDVLDQVLREQFGYTHILWVYSGRRGIHCWVSDQAALALSNESRWALVEYLELVRGGAQSEKRVHTRYKNGLGAMHPMLSEALSTLQGGFSDLVLEDQDCFRSTEGWNKLLRLLPQDDDIIATLREKWEEQDSIGEPSSSIDKWEDMRREIKKISKDSTRKKFLSIAVEEIVLQYTYPRIDSNVSKTRNHLLKSPFCLHPSTGNVCVPVDPARIHEFDPTNVPNIEQLLRELDQLIKEDGTEHHSDWERTSLAPYVRLMDQHVAGLMKEVRTANRAAALKGTDF
ncbi:hypothetical protein BS47DRAFT_1395830 [Hydnum rufescens UP504]|uniref:DNA primase n=1 Tax=Hydnum rufescens UP504 TaxID=1448309 RepID=A0A9P6AS15_9AGAM|nr:hypothetical protein BS47DRAFT_1395830 [Hydnum rufescens UP504]